MGAFFKGAIPGDPIGSKVASKVDPLYDQHQAITAFNQSDVRRKQAAAAAAPMPAAVNSSSSLAAQSILNK